MYRFGLTDGLHDWSEYRWLFVVLVGLGRGEEIGLWGSRPRSRDTARPEEQSNLPTLFLNQCVLSAYVPLSSTVPG